MVESGKASVLRRWLGRFGGGARPAADGSRPLALAEAGGGPWDWTGGRAFRPDSDDIVFELTVFAARLAGGDGWIVDQAVLPPAEIERRLADEAGVTDIVMLGGGRGQGRDKQGFARPHRPASYTAIGQGWAFDQAAGCWRAPDEALPPFPWPATPSEALVLALGRPTWGWMPVVLAAGDRTAAFKADCGACPFPELVEWLETVAEGAEAPGGSGRFASLHGATMVEFLAFPAATAERVRIAVALYDDSPAHERMIGLDIDIERRALVLDVYGGLRAYADGPDFRPFAWSYVRLQDELARRFPDIGPASLAGLDAAGLGQWVHQLNERDGAPAEGEGAGDLPDVPAAWDGWDEARRRAWLAQLMEANVSRWIGTDLRRLRSITLERFLGPPA